MTFAKLQQGGKKYSQHALLIVIISQEVAAGKEKHRVKLSGSSKREAEENQKAGEEGFDACSTSTAISHCTVMQNVTENLVRREAKRDTWSGPAQYSYLVWRAEAHF